jgi:hypothetical protein
MTGVLTSVKYNMPRFGMVLQKVKLNLHSKYSCLGQGKRAFMHNYAHSK